MSDHSPSSTLPRPPRATDVHLRPITAADLPALFENQCDPVASRMAMVNPRTREEFNAVWAKILTAPPPRLVPRVIIADGEMVGTINCFQRKGTDAETAPLKAGDEDLDYVGYWIARDHWGRGITSRALAALLTEVKFRPLYARVARSNTASLRVLQSCGFTVTTYHQSPGDDPRYPACEEAYLRLQ